MDELGELPVPLQAKVLRAVEDGEVQPVGSNAAPTHVDVRLVCATNRDLRAMMREGKFRDDLYYRLSVMTMELPPLRSYKADNLLVIAQVFLKQASERHAKRVTKIGPEALALLMAHDYPGNVRELKNAIEHAVILAASDTVSPADLPATIVQPTEATEPTASRRPTLAEARERWLAPLETRYLRDLLEESGGNVRAAAALAGVNPVTLYKLLDKRGMSRSRGHRRT